MTRLSKEFFNKISLRVYLHSSHLRKSKSAFRFLLLSAFGIFVDVAEFRKLNNYISGIRTWFQAE